MKIVKKIILIVIAVFLGALYSFGVWPRAIYNTDIGANSYENTGALQSGVVLQQEYTCVDDGMCGLKIKLTKQESQTIGNYNWSLTDSSTGKTIASGVIDEESTGNSEFVSSSAQKRGNVELDVPRQKDSKGKKYVLSIQSDDVAENQTMAMYMTEKSKVTTVLSIDGNNIDNKAIVLKVEYKRFNVETFIVFLGIMLYLYCFVKFVYRLFR